MSQPQSAYSVTLLFAVSLFWAIPLRAQRDEVACKVRAVEHQPRSFENIAASPTSNLVAITQLDAKGVYQVYTARTGSQDLNCISCAPGRGGAPRLQANKPVVSWHPSGQWLIVGVEETSHDLMWMPTAWKRGLLQSGIWLNLWITTASGDRWYQITDFKKGPSTPSDGFVGTAFTLDGHTAVWAEIVDGNVVTNHFGRWRLYAADFRIGGDGAPSLVNKRDITPAGARWIEPGNFAPDGKRLLISTDIGLKDAWGQDQWELNIETGQLRNLTNSPDAWDEHGLYSTDGSKISFMSSYPYRGEKNSNNVTSLKTEFMVMDSDGSHLRQVTHFNTPGYAEFQNAKTVAAVAGFIGDGSQLYATVMAKSFAKTNWLITFVGPCGTTEP